MQFQVIFNSITLHHDYPYCKSSNPSSMFTLI